jgi:hypothetical protein
MRQSHLSTGLVLGLGLSVMTAAVAARGQGSPAADQTEPVSTRSGVYTDAQARRGEEAFSNNCISCHTTATYTTTTFRNNWNGATVWDLFSYMSDSMPEDAPGSLAPADYAAIVAYFLKLNRLPTGETELSADAETLRTIKIELGSGTPMPAVRR